MVGYEMLAQAQRDLTPEQVRVHALGRHILSPHFLTGSQDLGSHHPNQPHKNLHIPRTQSLLSSTPW